METAEFQIPPELFMASVNSPRAVFSHSMYPSQKGIEVLLRASCARFGVRPYGLARLLGAEGNYIYRWLSGKRRMSSVYLSRLCYLLMLHRPGQDLGQVREIDWQLGNIIFRDGRISDGHELLQGVFDAPRKPKPVQRRRKEIEKPIEHHEAIVVLGSSSRVVRGDSNE